MPTLPWVGGSSYAHQRDERCCTQALDVRGPAHQPPGSRTEEGGERITPGGTRWPVGINWAGSHASLRELGGQERVRIGIDDDNASQLCRQRIVASRVAALKPAVMSTVLARVRTRLSVLCCAHQPPGWSFVPCGTLIGRHDSRSRLVRRRSKCVCSSPVGSFRSSAGGGRLQKALNKSFMYPVPSFVRLGRVTCGNLKYLYMANSTS
jgi:hypothetical protein